MQKWECELPHRSLRLCALTAKYVLAHEDLQAVYLMISRIFSISSSLCVKKCYELRLNLYRRHIVANLPGGVDQESSRNAFQ